MNMNDSFNNSNEKSNSYYYTKINRTAPNHEISVSNNNNSLQNSIDMMNQSTYNNYIDNNISYEQNVNKNKPNSAISYHHSHKNSGLKVFSNIG